MPEISVVAPVRNVADFLPGLLASLDAQTLPRDAFEVVVVDDRSNDSTRELLDAWASGADRRVVSGAGRGPAAARNVGIAAARAAWIAFTDGDTLPEPAWLERLLAAAKRSGANVLEGAVDPWPRDAVNGRTHLVANVDGGRYMTANMAYRSDLLQELGGFDEQFGEPFLEDSDLAFRALDAGARVEFVRDAVVRHRVFAVEAASALRGARRARWYALIAKKHPVRYREQLRPVTRPLTTIELDVLGGLAAAAASTRASGLPRLVLLALAANGIKRGVVPAVRGVAPAERPAAAAVAIASPPLRAFWWLAGCLRFRKAVW